MQSGELPPQKDTQDPDHQIPKHQPIWDPKMRRERLIWRFVSVYRRPFFTVFHPGSQSFFDLHGADLGIVWSINMAGKAHSEVTWWIFMPPIWDLKNMNQIGFIFPKNRGETTKKNQPQPSRAFFKEFSFSICMFCDVCLLSHSRSSTLSLHRQMA